jgi:hypothetical protein
VVAPAIPLPAQVVEDPLVGLSVPEEGVEAKAGKASAKDRVRKNVTLNFTLKGVALLGKRAEILFGHKPGSSFRIFCGQENRFVVRPTEAGEKPMQYLLLCE